MASLSSDVISPLGRRLLYTLLLIGSAVTLLASATVLWTDYRHGIRQYQNALDQIRSSYQSSITYSLWNFDRRQLETQLQGIMSFPGVIHVQLDQEDKVVHSLGDLYRKPDQRLTISLDHESSSGLHHLGMLRISQNYQELYDALLGRALEIFLTQFILVFSVAIMLLLIVHRLITRRLSRMSAWASAFSLEQPHLELKVDRPGDEHDELSQVADAINGMRITLLADLNLRETEHRHLEELQEQLTLAVDNAALGFCRYNLQTDTFECNSHFAAQLGSNDVEIETVRQPMEFFLNRITGPDAAQQSDRIRQLLLGHQVRLHDSFRMIDKQQQQRFFDISLQVIRYEDNRPQQVLICMVDRTKELKAREQLNFLRLHLEQEVDRKTMELQQETHSLTDQIKRQQRELQQLQSTRQPQQMHTICRLLADDLKAWQPLFHHPSVELWQRFFTLDLFAQPESIDIGMHIRRWLQELEQRHNYELELHLPLSLISEENPQVLTFILHSLLLKPEGLQGDNNRLNVRLRIGENALEAELRLSGNGWPQHPDNQAFRLCQALAGLRYNGELNWRMEEQQQVLLLSMPFMQ